MARLQAMVGVALGDGFNACLRESFGGLLGCSHMLALAQLLAPTVAGVLAGERGLWRDAPVGQRIFRRDLVFDGHEIAEGHLAIGIQLADLGFRPTPPECLPMDRFASQYELRLRVALEGWPAVIKQVSGGQRHRDRDNFSAAAWEDADQFLGSLVNLNLGKGAAAEIARRLAANPPARDALLMLSPALIQCRAAFPDKWLNQVATAPGHPGLIAMPDSCYMWRRDGALAKVREDLISKQAEAKPDSPA
jgi:hypothetical protein